MKKLFLYNPRWKSRKNLQPLVCRAAGMAKPDAGYQENVEGNSKDYCGIFWCESGSAEFEIGDNAPVRLFPGDVLCYSAGESHHIKIDSSGFSYYWAVWSGSLAGEHLEAYMIESGRKIHLDEPLKELFLQLFNAMREFSVGSVYEGGVILNQILAKVAYSNCKEHAENATEQKQQPLIEHFKDIINSEFHDPALNLDAVSEMLKVHRTTLCRIVKKQLGVSPAEYLQGIRLRSALSLLKSSSRTVKEISFECGFSTPSYFSKVIKAKTGFTPNEFRLEDVGVDS